MSMCLRNQKSRYIEFIGIFLWMRGKAVVLIGTDLTSLLRAGPTGGPHGTVRSAVICVIL